MFIFVTKSEIGMFQLRGGGSELNFRYTTKMGGYANMSSDIPKLGEIVDFGYRVAFTSQLVRDERRSKGIY